MIIGSVSGWFTLAGMMARPARDLVAHELRRDLRGIAAPNDSPRCWRPEEVGHLLPERARGAQLVEVFAPAHVLADGDELHLGVTMPRRA
jgi:hypothetical protein